MSEITSRTMYRAIARALTVPLLIAGLGGIFGGIYAHSLVSEQLEAQNITMPEDPALTTQEMKDKLGKYSGETMSSGPEAEAFANYYIKEHLDAMADGKTYSEVSGEYQAMLKNKDAADPARLAELGEARQSLFMGESLRGMLLTSSAFWKVGTIVIIGGWVALILGLGSAWFGFLYRRGSGAAPATAGQGSSATSDRGAKGSDAKATDTKASDQ